MKQTDIKLFNWISLAIFFFNLAVQFYFHLPSLKYIQLLAIGSPLFRTLAYMQINLVIFH